MTAEQKQAESPALKGLAPSYPGRFEGRVPKKVRVLENVVSDWPVPIKETLCVRAGSIVPVWVNKYGAVAAIFPDGQLLGLKPDEFEVTKWHKQAKV